MAFIIDTATLTPHSQMSADEASWVYNALDCCVTVEAYQNLIQSLNNQTRATYELEKAMQGPVLDMNMAGLPVDHGALEEAKQALQIQLAATEEILNEFLRDGYGVPDLNWRSPTQLQAFLYDYLGLPVQRKRNAKGQMAPTADRNALEKLQHYFVAQPFINCLMVLREVGKDLGFLETSLDADGLLRSSFSICGTTTGRLASAYSNYGTGTNLQNIKRILRKIFIARPGHKFLNLDLEQADSRNVGAACWNKFLTSHGPEFAGAYLDACEGGDLHTTVTHMAWSNLDWPDDETLWRALADEIAYRDYSYRDLAKRLGHGSNYYGQPPTMAKHAKLPVQLAVDFQHNYFTAFPCVPAGHEYTKRQLAETSKITTILGRERCFFGRHNDDKTLRDAIAYEGQSATADEINIGMMRLWREGKQFPGFQLRLQVHDSLAMEYAEECEHEFVPWALEALKVPVELAGGRQFTVPTEAKVGWNLGDYDSRNPDANPDGLMKWKGRDTRTRSKRTRKLFAG